MFHDDSCSLCSTGPAPPDDAGPIAVSVWPRPAGGTAGRDRGRLPHHGAWRSVHSPVYHRSRDRHHSWRRFPGDHTPVDPRHTLGAALPAG